MSEHATSERTALVTGATSGIGYVTALELAGQGMHVVLHARNAEKVEQVRADIERRTGNGDLVPASGYCGHQFFQQRRWIDKLFFQGVSPISPDGRERCLDQCVSGFRT